MKERDVFAVLGYTPVLANKSGHPQLNDYYALQEVLGPFVTIQFRLLRFGVDAFELTVTRVFENEATKIETVAGLVTDSMSLDQEGKEVVFVSFDPNRKQMCLKFWSRE